MQAVRRIVLALVAAIAGIVYVWIAAVRAAPGVRSRKAERRAARRRSAA